MITPRRQQIYFIKPVGMDGPVKIGCSAHPSDRLNELSKWSPVPLEIVATAIGCFTIEKAIHRTLAAHYSHKEWFHADPPVVALMEAVRAGVPILDAISLTPPRNKTAGWRMAMTRPSKSEEHA